MNLGVSMETCSKYCKVYFTGMGVRAHPLPKKVYYDSKGCQGKSTQLVTLKKGFPV